MRLRELLSGVENDAVIGLGASGGRFAQIVSPGCAQQKIETISFSRERANRVLACEIISRSSPVTLIDDIAVSGATFRQAIQSVKAKTQTVGSGLLYDSKTTRKEIGLQDIRSPIIFSRVGGGRVPINSIDSLVNFPERCQELADRYFGGGSELFDSLTLKGARDEFLV